MPKGVSYSQAEELAESLMNLDFITSYQIIQVDRSLSDKNNKRKFALFMPSKGYWNVSPFSGVCWERDILKATLFTSEEVKSMKWIEDFKASYHQEYKWVEANK